MAYSARTLSPAIESALQDHLSICAECRLVAEAQQAVWSALDIWDPISVSADFDRKLYARIAKEQARPWYRRALNVEWSFRPGLPVAAACAAILAAFVLKGPVLEHQGDHQTMTERRIDIEQVERALDDIEMLKQIGVVGAAPNQPARSEPM